MGYLLWKVSLKEVTNTLKRLLSSFLEHQFFLMHSTHGYWRVVLCKVLCSKSLKTCFMDSSMQAALTPVLCLPATHLCHHKLCISHIQVWKDQFCCIKWKINPESKFNWSQCLGMKLLDVWVSGMLLYLLLRSLNQLFSYQRSRSPLLNTVLASPVTPGYCRSLQ